MVKEVQFRRGSTSDHISGVGFTGVLAEVTVDTTNRTLRVHDGVTKGGHELVGVAATQSLSNKTFSNYVSFGGTVSFATSAYLGDNDKLCLGDGNDLEIYHDGNDSFIDDANVGSLILRTIGLNNIDLRSGTSNLMLRGLGITTSVELYYNNTKRFETVSAGATVTGDLEVTGSVFKTSLRNYAETLNTIGNTGTASTINLANGNFVTATLTGNCVFTFTAGITTGAITFTLFLTNDATPSRSITWPTSVKWPNATVPVRTTAASKTDVYTFFSFNGGTDWYGNLSIYNYS